MVKLYRYCAYRFAGICLAAAFLCAAAGQAYAQPLSGNTYTIDKSQPASSNNFTSFSAFFTKLSTVGVSGPVEVTVQNGPYTEQVIADDISGASATNTITVKGNGQVLRYTASALLSAYTFRFNGADFVTLQNLTIEALGSTYAWGVHFMNNSNYNHLNHCSINVPNCSSFNADNSHGVIVCANPASINSVGSAAIGLSVVGCVISGSASNGPWNGIFINPQTSNTQADFLIEDNIIRDFRSVGIYLTNSRNVNVRYNRFTRPNLNSVSTTYGVYAINSCNNDTIVGNRIYDCFAAVSTPIDFYGFNISTVSDVLVANNLVYENNNLGKWHGIWVESAPRVKVVFNTFSNDNNLATAGLIYGFYHNFSCCNSVSTIFQNNIISIKRAGNAARYGIYQNGSAISIDYNNLYVTGAKANYGWVGGADKQTFADWKSASGNGSPFDNNSTAADPTFLNISLGDFTPQSVTMDGIGNPATGVAVDINNFFRDNVKPDPGAVEFTVDANVTAISMDSKGCQGQKDTVKVWIKNNASVAILNFDVAYKVNGGADITQPFVGTINAADSALFVFKTPVSYTLPGTYNITTRIGVKPFFGPYKVTIDASPIGGSLSRGNPFKGQFKGGILADPDVVASPDTITFEYTPPSGLNYTTYGTQWAIKAISIKTDNGFSINPADTVFVAPSGSAAKVKFRPSASLAGSMVQVGFIPYSVINGCSAPEVTRYVYVAPKPSASFGFIDVCQNQNINFTNSSTISTGKLNYLWKFGDGDSSKLQNPVKLYKGFGSFTVTLFAISDFGYADSISKVVTVLPNPVPDFTYKNKCEGAPIPFINSSSTANGTPTYLWNFDDHSPLSSAVSPTHSYITPGLYKVSLTVTDAKGCNATISKPVTFSKKPTSKFSFPGLTCNQKKVPFTNNSIPSDSTGYLWDFGDGGIATGLHQEHLYKNAGNYTVKLYARNRFDCVDTATQIITLTEAPQADFAVSNLCAQEQVQFINTSSEPGGQSTDYFWDFGDGSAPQTIKSPVYTYTSIGKYSIVLKAMASNLCSSEIKKEIWFTEKPHVEFQLPAMACQGAQVILQNGSVISTDTLFYRWDFGDGRTSVADSPLVVYNKQGTYNIKLVATSGLGCADSVINPILIAPVPNSNFTFESAGTGDGTVIFTPAVINGPGTYTWLYGDGFTGNQKIRHSVQYVTIGNKNVTLQVVDGQCSSITSQQVTDPLGVFVPAYQATGYSLYPNPTQGNVFIDMPPNTTVKLITVYDAMGRQVFSQSFDEQSLSYQVQINLSGLSDGLYTVDFFGNTYSKSFKINLLK
jgi:PKD repeat protein